MPTLRNQRHPPTSVTAYYDVVRFIFGQDPDINTGCHFELTTVQDYAHILVIAGLHPCLSRSRFSLSAPHLNVQETTRRVSPAEETVYRVDSASHSGCWRHGHSFSVSLGTRKAHYLKDEWVALWRLIPHNLSQDRFQVAMTGHHMIPTVITISYSLTKCGMTMARHSWNSLPVGGITIQGNMDRGVTRMETCGRETDGQYSHQRS